jgi:molecular chaperone DnaK (HSP70)
LRVTLIVVQTATELSFFVLAEIGLLSQGAMMIVGIDLGTTNSLAACMTPAGPRLIPNALGDSLTPSIVGLDRDGQVLVGRAARELRVTAPERCSSMCKASGRK